jgi:hypothetical protein
LIDQSKASKGFLLFLTALFGETGSLGSGFLSKYFLVFLF